MIGRTAECAALREVLASATSGFSSTIVLRGEAGIGKTALLKYAVDHARDFTVLRVTGIESEMELGFAALHQLLRPLLPDIEGLPGRQRSALQSAFGLADGPPPDRFLIALATLTVLSEAAARVPQAGGGLLVAVDDAQWLDQASAEVLAFVARRLDADRVALVLAVREGTERHDYFEHLDSLRVRALPPADASELIRSLVTGTVSPTVALTIAERTGGSPLALVEATRELTGEQLAGAALLPDPLPLPADTREVYWRRLANLSPEQREFLLLAAVAPSEDPELLERACARLGLDPHLHQSEDLRDGVTVGDRILFRHPLIRSAVFTGSSHRDQRRAYAAIAAVSDPEKHPGRVAWYRAAAAEEPDEDLAVPLEEATVRFSQRGDYAAAAAFGRRAAELTPDPERRCERLRATARAEFTAGRVSEAASLLDQAEPGLRDPRQQAQAIQLRGEIQMTLGDGRQGPFTLIEAARAWAPIDPEASRNALLDAMLAQIYAGGHDWLDAYPDIRAADPGDGGKRSAIPDLMLGGLAAVLNEGPARGAPLLRQALELIADDGLSNGQRLRWYVSGIYCAIDLLDSGAWQWLADRCSALCRSRGVLATLPTTLDYVGVWSTYAGHLTTADAANAEARDILAATGSSDRLSVRISEALVPAWRGDEDAMREIAAEIREDSARRGQQNGLLYIDLAALIFGSATRDYESVLHSARVLINARVPAVCVLTLPFLVEAAVHQNDWETAEQALAWIRDRAEVSRTDWGLGLLAQGRALMVRDEGPEPDAEREALFTEAIGHFERAGMLSDLARTRLLFGEWLRRRRRKKKAQEQLRAAWQSFEAIGAAAFAERARLELAATGAATGPEAVPAGEKEGPATAGLTERERQIARLVVRGATNAEVAARLFISVSTVDYHLRHVYRKLGVTSRTQLSANYRDQL